MKEKFTPLEVFFSFKAEVVKDEDRKGAVNDINAQLKHIYEKLAQLDNCRKNLTINLTADQKGIQDDVKTKADKR